MQNAPPWSILQYFWPALSDNRYWNFFDLLLSGRLRQVKLYSVFIYSEPASAEDTTKKKVSSAAPTSIKDKFDLQTEEFPDLSSLKVAYFYQPSVNELDSVPKYCLKGCNRIKKNIIKFRRKGGDLWWRPFDCAF